MALPTASDNPFPSILITEGTEPTAPAAGKQRIYIDSTTHKFKRTDSSGVDVTLAEAGAATGSGLTMATARLLGRTTAATGAIEEISVGSGLSLSAGSLTATGGGATVATVDATLSGDVTIVSANTFVDGPSASFATGTWLVVWKIIVSPIVSTAQSYAWTGKLWDGSTILDESGQDTTNSGNQSGEQFHFGGCAIVVLGGTTTLKVSVACNRGSSASAVKRNVTVNSGSSNLGSRMVGYKVT